jgi:hypothetical protein
MTTRATTKVSITPAEAQDYRQVIERLAAGRISQRIPNGVPAHASILLEAMFKHAQRDVRIYSGKLSADTYDQNELVMAAKRFLGRRGTRLRILLQEQESTVVERKFIQALKSVDGACGEFELRTATGVYATDRAKHFAVMDECGYRFETNHEETKAVANFNEPPMAQELISAFDRAFEIATHMTV